MGTAMECTMWLWIFWRAKHDWREFLVGSSGIGRLALGTPAPLGGRTLSSLMITFVLLCLLVKSNLMGRKLDSFRFSVLVLERMYYVLNGDVLS